MDRITAVEWLALGLCAISILLNFVLPSGLIRVGRQPWSDELAYAASVVLACLGFGLLIAGSR
jgi:hypothetical protein